MAKPHNKLLTEYVLKQLYWHVPKGSMRVYESVRDDYGRVSHRQVIRHLKDLERARVVRFVVGHIECPKGGYVLVGRRGEWTLSTPKHTKSSLGY